MMAGNQKLCFFLLFFFHHCSNFSTSSAEASNANHQLPKRFFDITAPGSAPAPTPDVPKPAPGSAPAPTPDVPKPAPHSAPAPSPNTTNVHPPPPPPPPVVLPPPPSDSPLPSFETGQEKGSSSKLSGGQKAGIVIGTLAGTGILAFGGCIYMKRRNNVNRARLASSARIPVL
ncbi:hypothetical protein MANES_07G101000v8 [Manihot esculenta]|uniref:Uncharacterized protein n=2 Tax=Manihot esculenta TaxID=3983 RepID=A0A2C9VM56_MANES|nr:hypothetical protein MANES_07G101000v8 [Manihot esculenta]